MKTIINSSISLTLILGLISKGNAECTLGKISIQVGENAPQGITYPSSLSSPIKVYNADSVKVILPLEGGSDCKFPPLQSNLAFTRQDQEHFAYFPLHCSHGPATGTKPSERRCQVSVTAMDALLQAAQYQVNLLMAFPKADSPPSTTLSSPGSIYNWSLGTIDFRDAKVRDRKWGTLDQQEDRFTRQGPELRPFFYVSKQIMSWSAIATVSTIFLLPWIIYGMKWGSGIGTSSDTHSWTWSMAGLLGLMMAWMMLAVITWLTLNIFQTMIGSAILTPFTIMFTYYTFKPISTPDTPSKDD